MIENEKADWIKMKPAELEKIVIDLAKKGEAPAKIGLILRDMHGVPKAKLLGKKVTQILKEAKVSFKSDQEIIKGNMENIKKHIALHKHDFGAKRTLTKAIWSLHDLNIQEAQNPAK
jgi:ribosomal protein S15P/S13E